jgi:hypothetical protein
VQIGLCEFMAGRKAPFLLLAAEARAAVESAMRMRLAFSFNMQHSLVSRAAIQRLARHGPFFQSPYPDYYATTALLLTSPAVLVVPEPMVAIGISPRSFGFFHFNARDAEGNALLNNLGESIPEFVRGELVPGSTLLTCWFVAMACVERNFGREHGVRADRQRYRKLQRLYLSRAMAWLSRLSPRVFQEVMARIGAFPAFDARKQDVDWKNILELCENWKA